MSSLYQHNHTSQNISWSLLSSPQCFEGRLEPREGREREREREREKERDRETDRERQTDRQTERDTERERERKKKGGGGVRERNRVRERHWEKVYVKEEMGRKQR